MPTKPTLPTSPTEARADATARKIRAPFVPTVLRRRAPLLLLALAPILPSRAAQAQQAPTTGDLPVALVVRVQGDVRVERGDDAAPAVAGQRLLAGDRLIPEASARALLVVRSGAQQVVEEPTTLTTPAAAEPSDLFARAVLTLAQAASLDATLGGRQGMIRPIPGRSSLLAPANGLTVLAPRPSFRWTATPGARYEVMLRRVEGGRPEIFDAGTDTLWTLPPEAPALEPGATYAWTVFVGGREGGRPLPQQSFRVASAEEEEALAASLDAIRGLGLDPSDDGRVLAAIALRELELYYAADQALDALRSDGVALSPDLHRLHGEILAELGDADGARRAFDRAAATGGPR